MTLFSLLLLSVAVLPAASINAIPNFKVTPAAIQDLVNKMRDADTEKPTPCDVHLDYQQHYDGAEAAPNKLFKNVNPEVLKNPSYVKLLALRKHFNPQTGKAEVQSQQKIQAIKDFFDVVWKSGPFQELIGFMRSNNHPWTKDANTFRGAVGSLWFDMFSRAKGQLDSSAFEHVFFGEVKNNEVSGMHNWAAMYDMERTAAENFDYRGFIRKRFDVIAEVNLLWRGVEKRQGSFLANSSPAFDFAFLTACFLTHRGSGDRCFATIDGCNVEVQSYEQEQNGKMFIGTVYPSIGRDNPACASAYRQRQTCCMKY